MYFMRCFLNNCLRPWKNSRRIITPAVSYKPKLNGALNLSWTKAAGTYVNWLYRAAYKRLYLSYVRLPRAVCSSVRVADLYTEGYALTAYITLCHLSTPPISYLIKTSSSIVTQVIWICKGFGHIFLNFVLFLKKSAIKIIILMNNAIKFSYFYWKTWRFHI